MGQRPNSCSIVIVGCAQQFIKPKKKKKKKTKKQNKTKQKTKKQKKKN